MDWIGPPRDSETKRDKYRNSTLKETQKKVSRVWNWDQTEPYYTNGNPLTRTLPKFSSDLGREEGVDYILGTFVGCRRLTSVRVRRDPVESGSESGNEEVLQGVWVISSELNSGPTSGSDSEWYCWKVCRSTNRSEVNTHTTLPHISMCKFLFSGFTSNPLCVTLILCLIFVLLSLKTDKRISPSTIPYPNPVSPHLSTVSPN